MSTTIEMRISTSHLVILLNIFFNIVLMVIKMFNLKLMSRVVKKYLDFDTK